MQRGQCNSQLESGMSCTLYQQHRDSVNQYQTFLDSWCTSPLPGYVLHLTICFDQFTISTGCAPAVVIFCFYFLSSVLLLACTCLYLTVVHKSLCLHLIKLLPQCKHTHTHPSLSRGPCSGRSLPHGSVHTHTHTHVCVCVCTRRR